MTSPKVYYDDDADLSVLGDKTIGIIGYGSQGHAHALNLHDNGQKVIVGLAPTSQSRAKASDAGLEVGDVEDVTAASEIVMVLIPDHVQGTVFRQSIQPHLKPGSTLMFGHGFNIHYEQIVPGPDVNVSWWRPRPPATGCVRCLRKASEFRRCWPSTRTPQATPFRPPSPTPRG